MGLPKRHIALSETAVSGGFQISMMTSPSEWAHCGGRRLLTNRYPDHYCLCLILIWHQPHHYCLCLILIWQPPDQFDSSQYLQTDMLARICLSRIDTGCKAGL